VKRYACRIELVLRATGAVALLCLYACGEGVVTEPNPNRIVINNDEAALSQRIRDIGQVALDIRGEGWVGQPALSTRNAFELVLRAVVEPPVLDGIRLQATHVDFHQPKVYVSYNVQGPIRKGGVEVFWCPSADELRLWSQALFTDTDVSALDHYGEALYLATATSSPGFSSAAVLEEIELDGHKLTDRTRRVDLPSYAATGVRVVGDNVYVTSGDVGGGLSVLDAASLALTHFDAFDDARAVHSWNGLTVAMRGGPAEIRLYDDPFALLASHVVGGANIPESKSTVHMVRDLVFVAAGDEGLKVVSRRDGSIVQHIPVPDVQGVDPSVAVTNGVSVRKGLVFVANGGAGLFVYEAKVNLEEQTTTNPELQLVGQVQFPEGVSTNFVWSSGDLLFVANGLGGLRVVQIRERSGAAVSD
jgi:hypothetical protein